MKSRAAALLLTLAGLAWAAPAAAQAQAGYSLRVFGLFNEEQFLAKDTFKAIFGQATQMLWGGGISVVQDEQYYLDLSVSRFRKTGQRAFFGNGQAFPLGIPLTATLTPFEMTGGYRFHTRPKRPTRLSARLPPPSRLVPYFGAGVGLYRYQETSAFAQAGDDVTKQHIGFIVEGGLEVRLAKWIGIAAGANYTHVPGILGTGGVSQDAGEGDLGGISGRFRLLIGK